MYDRTKAAKPPPLGVCCATLNSNELQIGPREYIYNLIAQPATQANPQKKLPMIRKVPPPLADEVSKAPHKSMGPPTHPHTKYIQLPQKYPYKKKHWKNPFIEKKCMCEQVMLKTLEFEKLKAEHPTGRIKGGCCTGVKPPVPTRQGLNGEFDKDGMQEVCKRTNNDIHRTNWVERNAIWAITRKPGFRQAHPGHRIQVDQRNGHHMALDSAKTHSGLEKRFIYKPAYGNVPKYLKTRSDAIEATRKLYAQYLNEKALQTTDYLLTDKQRDDLLNGLKAAWDRYNACYLRLSGSSTTLKTKAYKLYLEDRLQKLENDILLIQGHTYIFIDANKQMGVGNEMTEDVHV